MGTPTITPPVTHWNYRVIRSTVGSGELIAGQVAIHEVHYDGDRPHSWSALPDAQIGNDVEDLRKDLELRRRALDKPVLEIVDGKLIEASG